MKKILYVITKSNWGGAQRYVFDLATSLPRDQFVPVVALGGRGALALKLEAVGIRTISISKLARDVDLASDATVFFKLLKIFLTERPAVVHLNSPKVGGMGTLAARLAFIPKIIYTAHGWTFNEERSGLQKGIIKFLSWITVLLSHTTICIAERERSQIANWMFASSKIDVIHNGITATNFKSRTEARDGLAHKNPFLRPLVDNIWLGTIAELHPNKGLDLMLEALHEVAMKYTGLTYVIIGDGQERVTLENKIKEKQLENVVYLTGHVDEAKEYLLAFDAFVLPSRKEGFPYAILEAGSASLPVIASRVGGISELIVDGQTGLLVDPNNTTTLVEALEKILSDETLRHQLGNNLKERIEANFSLKQMVKKTVQLY